MDNSFHGHPEEEKDEFSISYHLGPTPRLLRAIYGMFYAIPRPKTPTQLDNAKEFFVERLNVAPDEVEDAKLEGVADPGEMVLESF